MGRFTQASAIAAILLSSITSSVADSSIPTCGAGNLCPASAPCCSQYGQCGAGAYCLGGCDPLFSKDLSSCVPAAVCQDEDYKLTSLDDVQSIEDYLGDYSSTNWVASGTPTQYSNGDNQGILLTMAQDTVGTLLQSTHYVWYGKVCATLRTSQGAGVVTAFILMSDVKDEIDFEFVGVDINHAQSNFYSQGVTNYNNELNLTVSGDTVSQDHTYCVDWQPDSLTWSVDGKDMRTLQRQGTWNSTANRFDYPQTPAKIMLSLWPAGLPSNGKGTVDWAGGQIQWNSPYMSDGYYYALVKEVTVKCYDPPTGAQVSGSKSYTYTDTAGTNNSIKIVDNVVVLKSLLANGDNPNLGQSSSQSSGQSKTQSSSGSSTPTVQTIPGVVGAGGRGEDSESNSQSAASSQSTGSSSSGGSSGSGGSSDSGSGDSGSGFSQGGGSSGSGKSGASGNLKGREGKVVGGSALAVIVALGAMLML